MPTSTPNTRSERPHRLRSLWHTTIGKKWLVAITGLILLLYVIAHMLGNLKTLQGAGGGTPAIDRYAEWVRDVGSPVIPHEGVVWAVRAFLLTALVLHVYTIYLLTLRNYAAKPAGHRPKRVRGSLAARYMGITGLLILAFVVFHILHFTTGTIRPTAFESGEVYSNLYHAFDEWWIVAVYLGAVGLVGLHFWHGLWSANQTAGLDNPDRNWFWRTLGTSVTAAVVVGFAIVPLLIFAGALPEPVEAVSASR